MKIKTARKQPIMDKLISKEEGARIEEITTAITVEESLEDLTRSLEDLTIGEEVPFIFISSIANTGLINLKDKLWSMLNPNYD